MSFKETLALRAFGLAKIPMIAYLSPSVIELTPKRTIIKIPLNWRTKNHLGSMYFAAMSAGADIAGGLVAMNAIKESGQKVSLSFKTFTADFKMLAKGYTYFYNEQGQEIANFVASVIATPGVRQNMSLKMMAKCPNISDDVVAEFSLTLSLKAKVTN